MRPPPSLLAASAVAAPLSRRRALAGPAGWPAPSAPATGCRAPSCRVRAATAPTAPAVTGPEGRFRVAGLAAGDYALAVDAPGFRWQPGPRVAIGAGEARLDLVLRPAPVREQRASCPPPAARPPLSTLGVSATVLDARAHRRARSRPTCCTCCRRRPAWPSPAPAASGLQASAFVRGGESRFARVLVDGVPVNEPGGAFNFGSALPLELERVEVVRGAASSLYGTDALGGRRSSSSRAAPAPARRRRVRAEAEGGTLRLAALAQAATVGPRGAFDWNVGAAAPETDNEEPNSAFEQTAAASLGARSATARSCASSCAARTAACGHAGPDGLRAARPRRVASSGRPGRSGAHAAPPRRRASPQAARRATPRPISSRANPLDSGSYTPRYGERSGAFAVSDFPNPDGFQNDTARLRLGYQAEGSSARRHLLTAGADARARDRRRSATARTDLLPRAHNVGAYLRTASLLGARAFLTLRRARRAQRQLRHARRAARRAGAAAARRRGRHDAARVRRRGDQGAELLRVLRRLVLRPGQPRPEAGAQPHLRPRPRAAPRRRAAARRGRRSSTTTTSTRSPTASSTSTPSRAPT